MALAISTPAFAANQKIPERFARDGGNVSPQLQWSGAPLETRSFALIVEDPDAPKGTFRHWAAYNIPAQTNRLHEGAGSQTRGAATGMKMAKNDFGNAVHTTTISDCLRSMYRNSMCQPTARRRKCAKRHAPTRSQKEMWSACSSVERAGFTLPPRRLPQG